MTRGEAILEPDLPIVDAHHHLLVRGHYDYLENDLLADVSAGHRIVATIHIECGHAYRERGPGQLAPVGETEFVAAVGGRCDASAGDTRVCLAVVGRADLTLGGAVDEVLEAHLAAAPGRFRGIRHIVAWDSDETVHPRARRPSADLLKDAAFRAGFARLARYDLSFDAWLYHPQIGDLTALARLRPETPIVLNHLGGPLGIGSYASRREEVFETWSRSIAELATCPNVSLKLGGLNMPLNGFGWHERPAKPDSQELAAATRRYFLHAIDCFGPDRCMFESNFPVDGVSCSYVTLWNSFKIIAEAFSPDEKRALFHDTAARFYRLPTDSRSRPT